MQYLITKTSVSLLTILGVSIAVARPVSLSISTDGKYAISSNDDNNIYLYDLQSKTIKKVNDGSANQYSANFIKDTDNFIYQDDKNIVHVVDADSLKQIKKFNPKFKSQGFEQVNKDLNTYVGSDKDGNVVIQKIDDTDKTYMFGNKYQNMTSPYNPSFTDNNKIVVTTSGGELWIFNPTEIFKKEKDNKNNQIEIVKNAGQTMNAIDPSGKFIYTMDTRAMGIEYSLEKKEVNKYTQATSNPNNYTFRIEPTRDKKLLDFLTYQNKPNQVSNFKFIDKDKFIVGYTGVSQPFMWLGIYPNKVIINKTEGTDYTFAKFVPENFLPLVSNPKDFLIGNYRNNTAPYPITGGFNTNFDTSVEAHRLVMAQANGDGIMVYKYNPSDESLKLEWVGEPPKVADDEKDDSEKKGGWFW